MIKLRCHDVPEDYIEAKACTFYTGNVFIETHEKNSGTKQHAVSLTPEKARALGLALIKLAGGVYTP